MKVPNDLHSVVDKNKIVNYLLSESHRDSRHKAKFFQSFGFSIDSWETLAQTLKTHAAEHDVARTEDSPFGTRYAVDTNIETPNGRRVSIRSVWFIDDGESDPRLVTAHPLKRSEDD